MLGEPDPWALPRPGDALITGRDPSVHFHSILDAPDCADRDTGLDRLAPDLADAAATPAFSLIVPNACHDASATPCAEGAPAGTVASDAFLRTVVPQITASAAYKDGGLLLITFDAPRPRSGARPRGHDDAHAGVRGRARARLTGARREADHDAVEPLRAPAQHRRPLRPRPPGPRGRPQRRGVRGQRVRARRTKQQHHLEALNDIIDWEVDLTLVHLPRTGRATRLIALLGVLLSGLLATAVLTPSAYAGANPNNYDCRGHIGAGVANPLDEDTQVKYVFACNGPILGYQIQPDIGNTGFDTDTTVFDLQGNAVTTDSFTCNGDFPGYGFNCVGVYTNPWSVVTGQFTIATALCAEPRVDVLLTVVYATADATRKVTQAISGPYDLGRPHGCPKSARGGKTRIPSPEQLKKQAAEQLKAERVAARKKAAKKAAKKTKKSAKPKATKHAAVQR